MKWECVVCHIENPDDWETCAYCNGDRSEVGRELRACNKCNDSGWVAMPPGDPNGHHDIRPCPNGCRTRQRELL